MPEVSGLEFSEMKTGKYIIAIMHGPLFLLVSDEEIVKITTMKQKKI